MDSCFQIIIYYNILVLTIIHKDKEQSSNHDPKKFLMFQMSSSNKMLEIIGLTRHLPKAIFMLSLNRDFEISTCNAGQLKSVVPANFLY